MYDPLAPRIVIVGGGTAGWMTAAALSHVFGKTHVQITLVESEQIGTVGVGEATIPHLRYFNERLGISEPEFLQATNATYKLGIQFINWGALGQAYIHPFGVFGQPLNDIDFYHLWNRYQQDHPGESLFDYSASVVAAASEKFSYPGYEKNDPLSEYSYAFHIDASRYATFLRQYSEERHVHRTEGKIIHVQQNDLGNIEKITLDNEQEISGDFFIDCSGFRSLLLGQTMKMDFVDWSHWLPCNRAIAVPTTSVEDPIPYTKATALTAGWQWRIPLQHRVGNGHVYCSKYLSDDEALQQLRSNLSGEELAEPRLIQFKTGRHQKSWEGNCVGIGLSSGFLEPLESTSIYLIQIAIMKLIEFFPRSGNNDQRRNEFNRQMNLEYDRIKDFLILHYHATQRDDTEFWNYCRTMSIPESLKERMDAFKMFGYLKPYKHGLFMTPSWVAVLIGQGIIPETWHLAANRLSDSELHLRMQHLKKHIHDGIQKMPNHYRILKQHCDTAGNTSESWPSAAMSLYSVFS